MGDQLWGAMGISIGRGSWSGLTGFAKKIPLTDFRRRTDSLVKFMRLVGRPPLTRRAGRLSLRARPMTAFLVRGGDKELPIS